MPKLYLPPQGGEKWLCIFTFLFMMFRYFIVMYTVYTVYMYTPPRNILTINIPLWNKEFYNPQNVCISSVLCTVIIIYCIVIIYIPSMKENGTEFQVRKIEGFYLLMYKITLIQGP